MFFNVIDIRGAVLVFNGKIELTLLYDIVIIFSRSMVCSGAYYSHG